ncbi:DUF1659 domain-containing protein [uncultured Clostridium sp.]|uniref:DUF1659 domain-containing protein n=1 Tax=uncultured Clostridium sp. TaxID=59620 RepID=UPI00260598F9|nr:DUF1659 domain-containing protein [uncultured Clostridium sp.]
MTNQNIIKSTLVLQYHFGLDSHGNPAIKKQRFASIKAESPDAQVKAVGDAFASLIATSSITVQKEETIDLEPIPTV